MPRFANTFAATTPLGASLQHAITSLYGGDSPYREQERAALVEQRRQQAALDRARMEESRAKVQAEQDAAAARANAPRGIVESFGLPVDPTLDFIRGRDMNPVARDDEGFPMPAAPAPRPSALQPADEAMIRSVLRDLAIQGGLTGKTNFKEFQEGRGEGQKQSIIDVARTGGTQPIENIAEAFYATEAKPLYSERQGRVLRQATGALNEGGAQATANVVNTAAQAGERRAHTGLYGAQTDWWRNRPQTPEKLVAVKDPETGETVWMPASEAGGQPAALPPRAAPAAKPVTKAVSDTIRGALDELTGVRRVKGKPASGSKAPLAGTLESEIVSIAEGLYAEGKAKGPREAAKMAFDQRIGGAPLVDETEPGRFFGSNKTGFRVPKPNAAGGAVKPAGAGSSAAPAPPAARAPASTTAAAPEPTATDPKTGRKVVYRNGAWQPLN